MTGEWSENEGAEERVDVGSEFSACRGAYKGDWGYGGIEVLKGGVKDCAGGTKIGHSQERLAGQRRETPKA